MKLFVLPTKSVPKTSVPKFMNNEMVCVFVFLELEELQEDFQKTVFLVFKIEGPKHKFLISFIFTF